MTNILRTRWAAIGAAVAVTLGAGGLFTANAAISTGEMPVYVSLSEPCRIIDTRPAPNNVGIAPGKIRNGEANAITIQITGSNGNCTGPLAIPTDAVAVALNLTAVNPSTASNFRMYPADGNFPTTSNLNFSPERSPVANKVDVGLSSDGKVKLSNAQGTADAAIDVFGYYVDHIHESTDITNEAGLSAAVGEPIVDVTTAATVVSTKMRVPSSGTVVVQANGTVWHLTNGGTDQINCQIQKGAQAGFSSGIFATTPYFTAMDDIDDGNAISFSNLSTQRTFSVTTADNPESLFDGIPFRLVCVNIQGDTDVQYPSITATFYPTGYAPFTFIPILGES